MLGGLDHENVAQLSVKVSSKFCSSQRPLHRQQRPQQLFYLTSTAVTIIATLTVIEPFSRMLAFLESR